MRWSFGLHDFIEMKHHLDVGNDGQTSIYHSNLKFFRLYKNNLLGLTGTLGSEECKNFLHNIYFVDTVEVPTFKYKNFKELKP